MIILYEDIKLIRTYFSIYPRYHGRGRRDRYEHSRSHRRRDYPSGGEPYETSSKRRRAPTPPSTTEIPADRTKSTSGHPSDTSEGGDILSPVEDAHTQAHLGQRHDTPLSNQCTTHSVEKDSSTIKSPHLLDTSLDPLPPLEEDPFKQGENVESTFKNDIKGSNLLKLQKVRETDLLPQNGKQSKYEPFSVTAPAFPTDEGQKVAAPSQNDVQAILSQAHKTTKATVSQEKLAALKRRRELEEKTMKAKRSKLNSKSSLANPLPPTRFNKITASSILSQERERKPVNQSNSSFNSKSTNLEPGWYNSSDEAEIDVDTVMEDPESTLPVSIQFSKLNNPVSKMNNSIPKLKIRPFLSNEPVSQLENSLAEVKSTEGAQHRKKKKKKKEKHKKASLPLPAAGQCEKGSSAGIKVKINLKQQVCEAQF